METSNPILEFEDAQQRLEEAEAKEMARRRSEIYKHVTGRGTCPQCQSGNVHERLVPIPPLQSRLYQLGSWIDSSLWPPTKPGTLPGLECQACGHRWKVRSAPKQPKKK